MLPSWVNLPISDIRAYLPNLHYVDFCEMFVGYLLPQSTAMGSKNYQKKLQAQFYPEDPLGW